MGNAVWMAGPVLAGLLVGMLGTWAILRDRPRPVAEASPMDLARQARCTDRYEALVVAGRQLQRLRVWPQQQEPPTADQLEDPQPVVAEIVRAADALEILAPEPVRQQARAVADRARELDLLVRTIRKDTRPGHRGDTAHPSAETHAQAVAELAAALEALTALMRDDLRIPQ